MSEENRILAKHSGLSIGLAITVGVFVFFGGLKLGQIESRTNTIEAAQIQHSGSYLKKSEAEIRFEAISLDIQEIKETQKEILKELRND